MSKRAFTVLVALLSLLLSTHSFASVYLDGNAASCTDGATDYAPSTRSCGSGSDTVYVTLSSFESGIVAGETNYVRAGDYLRDNSNGTLRIGVTKSGSSNDARTVIAAYPGEEREAVFATEAVGKTYNSDPADASGVGSRDYYPNTVIAVSGSYITVRGVKTYGQVFSWGGHDVTFEDSDFGGGGPSENQGNVVKFHTGYNLLLKNSAVHHSCWGENTENGASVIMYDASVKFEQVTFYDSYGPDIFVKDTGGQSGRIVDIGYSHFKASSLNTASTGGGIRGHNQDEQADGIDIHHSIFQQMGYAVVSSTNSTIRNNTFVDCFYGVADSSGGGPHHFAHYNNVVYTTSASQYFASVYDQTYIASIDSDYNVLHGPGIWQKSAPDATTWATSLSAWQTFSSLDTNSINSDPQFVNATGVLPEDFKRVAYAENFTGSSYGTKAGAYVTGDEQIGADWLSSGGGTGDDTTPTPSPSGPILRTGTHLLRVGDSVLMVQ